MICLNHIQIGMLYFHQSAKLQLIESKGDGVPLVFSIAWEGTADDFAIVGIKDSDDLKEAIQYVIHRERAHCGEPFMVMVNGGVNVQLMDLPESVQANMRDIEDSSLNRRFDDGDPKVQQALNTLCMTKDYVTRCLEVYRWSPMDGYEFDHARVADSNEDAWEPPFTWADITATPS